MGSIGRYIFRTTFGAFMLVLISLTAVIWVTQALRDIDLVTNQGQTVLVFIAITGLIIPLLVMVIAPIALMVAVVHVLNKLSSDSELIVMNAAGMSPWRLFRAFMAVGVAVSLLVLFIGSYLSPEGLRSLNKRVREARADFVTNIIQPGRFTTVDSGQNGGLTFHIRERRSDGKLIGIFLDDRRDPKERSTVLAEQGEIIENGRGTFLVLETGSVQRHQAGQRDPNIVLFNSYAFDLSRFTAATQTVRYGVRERYLWELFSPPPDDPLYKAQPGQFSAELHDRLMAPFYPIAFVVIAYAYLGAPRTTRQSRAMSLLGAVAWVGALRLVGFASTVFGTQVPAMLFVQYIAVALTVGVGLLVISRGVVLEPPAFLTNAINAVTERIARRLAPA
jgi:lipopolysaccharide export system permease protein